MVEKLQIKKKSNLKGEDGYKTFSVRVKNEIVQQLEKISNESGYSRNELIGILLKFGIEHIGVIENEEK